MSEEQLHNQPEQPILTEPAGNLPESRRRRFLKGTVAIPVIMTLHSGAALARTSNLVGSTQDIVSAMTDANGDLFCVHPGSNGGSTSDNPVDLGDHPSATVNPIKAANGTTPDLQAQATSCKNGGGILVSATAWTSIGPRVTLL